jgi:hypothetical protein
MFPPLPLVVVPPPLLPPPASSAAASTTAHPRSATMAAAAAGLHPPCTRLVIHPSSIWLAQGRTLSDLFHSPPAPTQLPGRAAHVASSATAIASTCRWARQPPPPRTMPGASGKDASHLCDKVRADIRTVDGNGPISSNAAGIAKAFVGRAG